MLTEAEIKKLQLKETRYRKTDQNGLVIEVMPSGAKYWRKRFEKTFVTIGQWPDISLKEARILALDILEQKLKQDVITFAKVSDEWLSVQEWSEKYREKLMYRLKKYILPVFGNRDIATITRVEILTEVRKFEILGQLETCNRILGIIRQVYDYAINCGYCENNPASTLSKAVKSATHMPMAAPTKPQEIKNLIRAIKDFTGSPVLKYLMLWQIYTLSRPSESRLATWQEIDLSKKLWIIPSTRMKMRQDHVVPLPTQCMSILTTMKEYALSETWLFPSLRVSKPFSDMAVNNALRNMGFNKEEITGHGFRAMASTTLNEMGYRPDLIEKSLAHGDKDKIRAIYNRAEYLEERRAMLQHYANWLDSL